MEARHGTCAECGAKYKVPATFKADKARCKACGGVVAIGPIQDADAPDASAEAAADLSAAPAPPAVPAEKPAPRKPAPGPVARPVAPGAAKPARTPRPTPARATETDAGESEEAPAKPRTRTRAAAGMGAASGRRAAGAKHAGARRSSTRGGTRGDEGADEAQGKPRAGGRRRTASHKKKSSTTLIAVLAVAVLAAGGGWYMLNSGGEGVAAKDTTAQAPESGDAQDAVLDDSSSGEQDTGLDDTTSGAEDAPAVVTEEPKPKKPKKAADPDSVDLLALSEFGPAPETSAEDWAQYEEWVAAVVDPDSGILGSRARKHLKETGRAAFPALVNGMRKLDYGNEVEMRAGDRCQTALREILSGINFGWKYTTSPDDEYFNKKVVVAFHKQWVKAENDLEYYIKMAKLDEEQAAALRAELGGVVDSPSHEDDDLFDIDD